MNMKTWTVTGLCFLAIAAPLLQAQDMAGRGPARPIVFSVSAGLMFDSENAGLAQWSLDLSAGIRLGRHFQLSPEMMFAGSPGYSFFYPGIILNVTGRRVFAGAGLVKPVEMAGYGDTALAAKFVLGFVRGPIILTGFFMGSVETDEFTSLFDHYRIGLTAGFRF